VSKPSSQAADTTNAMILKTSPSKPLLLNFTFVMRYFFTPPWQLFHVIFGRTALFFLGTDFFALSGNKKDCMKKFYNLLSALLCVFFCAHLSQAQSKLWFVTEDSPDLNYMDTDGSNVVNATSFTPSASNTDSTIYGHKPVFTMQASNGEIFAVTKFGGVEDFGTLVKITKSGLQKIRDLGYAQDTQYLTEGTDGYIYGVKTSAFDYYLFRFKPDGSEYQEKYFRKYGFRARDLTTLSTGQIIGTTNFEIYSLKPDLSGINIHYTFTKATGNSPVGKIIQGDDGYLYGVTRLGGAGNYGVVYKVTPSGENYTVLHQFNISNGRYPDRGLVQDNNGNLYGVTERGGANHNGVIFKIKKDGTGFEKLYDFKIPEGTQYSGYANELQLDSEGNLYGVTPGYYGRKIFKFNTNTRTYTTFDIGDNRVMRVNLFNPVNPAIRVNSPANGSTNALGYGTFHLTYVPGSLWYTIELSKNPDFSGQILSSTRDNPHVGPLQLEYNTKYYARAKSSLWPYYGVTTSFTTRTAESLAFISNPKDGAINVEAPTLKVTANEVRGSKRYTIQLSTTVDFSANVMTKTSAVDHQRTLTFEGLAFSTKYYARMKTDISNYGRVSSFTTKPDPASATVAAFDGGREADNMRMQVHPNPSTSSFNVALSSAKAEPVKVVITDLRGEVVGSYETGSNSNLTIGDELGKGIYILKILRCNEVLTHRMIKQ
jgi:uncharacterized repeat protein (TIGR03803 family)